MAKANIGNPYLNSDRKARLFKSVKSAYTYGEKKHGKGKVYQIGSGKIFVFKP